MGGAEPGARPVGDAGVERHSDDGDVCLRHLVEAGEPGEGRGAGEARNLGRVNGSDGCAHAVTSCAVGLILERVRM